MDQSTKTQVTTLTNPKEPDKLENRIRKLLTKQNLKQDSTLQISYD